MNEFCFFGGWPDALEIVEYLFRLERFRFVLDQWYSKPQPQFLERLTSESESILRQRKRVFIWSEVYSPFRIDYSKPGAQGLSMINPVGSGPMLDIKLPDYVVRDEMMFLGMGNLSYQTRYEDPITGELYDPPTALIRDYRQIRASIRKNMERRFVAYEAPTSHGWKWKVESIWITKQGISSLEVNEAAIWTLGQSWRNEQLKITSDEAMLMVAQDEET